MVAASDHADAEIVVGVDEIGGKLTVVGEQVGEAEGVDGLVDWVAGEADGSAADQHQGVRFRPGSDGLQFPHAGGNGRKNRCMRREVLTEQIDLKAGKAKQ